MLMNVLRFITWGATPDCPEHGEIVTCECRAPVTWFCPYTLPKVWVAVRNGTTVFAIGARPV